MERKAVVLHFPSEVVDKPVVSRMIKKYDVEVNIVQARVEPNEDGVMMVFMEGETSELKAALAYLRKGGVKVALPEKGLVRDEDSCVDCGACTAHCLPKALSIQGEQRRVVYEEEKCIACFLCVPACAYGALRAAL